MAKTKAGNQIMNNLNLDSRNRIDRPLWRRGFLLIPLILAMLALPQRAKAAQYDTAYGGGALASETTGEDNSAFGFEALHSNSTGIENTACGLGGLEYNRSGSANT